MASLTFLGLREYYILAEENGYPTFRWIGVAAGALIVCSVFLNGTAFGQVTENQSTAALLSIIVIVVAARSLTRGPARRCLSEWGVTFFGVMFVRVAVSASVAAEGFTSAGTIGHVLFVRADLGRGYHGVSGRDAVRDGI